jgi:hypothetical protein
LWSKSVKSWKLWIQGFWDGHCVTGPVVFSISKALWPFKTLKIKPSNMASHSEKLNLHQYSCNNLKFCVEAFCDNQQMKTFARQQAKLCNLFIYLILYIRSIQ